MVSSTAVWTLVWCANLVGASAQHGWRIVELSGIPGGRAVYPCAMNSHGVVVGAVLDGNGYSRAAAWDTKGHMRLLDTGSGGKPCEGAACDVGEDGAVYGYRFSPGKPERGECKAFGREGTYSAVRWDGKKAAVLATSRGSNCVRVTAPNKLGYYVLAEAPLAGGYSGPDANFQPPLPESWLCETKTGRKTAMSELVPERYRSAGVAGGMNDKGQMVFMTGDGHDLFRDAADSFTEIKPPSGYTIIGVDITDLGVVIGQIQRVDGPQDPPMTEGRVMPFIWKGGRLQTLPLPPGANNACPVKMSLDGDIVGVAFFVGTGDNPGPSPRPVQWRGDSVRYLDDVVGDKSWRFETGMCANGRGWIAGYGRRADAGGKSHACGYLLIPDREP